MKILVVSPYRGIGDLIFHLPLLRFLKKKYKTKINLITVHNSKAKIILKGENLVSKIVYGGGEINESDVTLAIASDALIFGFNVKANVQAKNLAKREKIILSYFSIIYEVIDEANKIIEGMFTPSSIESVIGQGVIKKIFEISDSSKVAGSIIEDGKVTSKAFARISRDGKQIAEVQIQSLRREKNQVKEVLSGLECGITFLKFNDLLENDKIEFFIRENNEKK